MARKDRRFGFEGGNIVPFSRGKYGVSSNWVASPSETNQRTIDSFPIMVVGALGKGSELQKYTKNVIRKKKNEKFDKLRHALETWLGSIDNNSNIS